MRLLLAALLSPIGLFPSLVACMLALVVGVGGVSSAQSLAAGLGAGLLLAGFGLGFGVLGALVVLLPGALALRAVGRASARTLAGLGLAAGMAVGLIEGGWAAPALFGVSGLGVGAAFGLLAGPALGRARPS